MKKLILSILPGILWSTLFLFYACEKKDLRAHRNQLSDNSKTKETVISWLNEQQLNVGKNRVSNISLLKKYLDFENLHLEELYDTKKLLVIPISKELASQKNIDKDREYNFVAIVDATNRIVSANVVIFKANNSGHSSAVPINTFSKLYKSKPLSVDGQFRMLHIGGNLLYLMDVKNGMPFSWGRYKTKNLPAVQGISVAAAQCTNYYLVMTYYENGVAVKETWTYIGQVCESEGGCGTEYEAFCPPGGVATVVASKEKNAASLMTTW